jgi:hypothetical protein
MFKIGDKVKHPEYPNIYEVVGIPGGNLYDVVNNRGSLFRGCILKGYEVVVVLTTAELVLKKVAIIEGRWKTHYEKQAMSKL